MDIGIPGYTFYAKHHSPNVIIKKRNDGQKLSELDLYRFEWTKNNYATDAFVCIHEIGTDYILEELVNTELAINLFFTFGRFFVKQIHADILNIEDIKYLNMSLFMPTSLFDWDRFFKVIDNHINEDGWSTFKEQAIMAHDLHTRIKSVPWHTNKYINGKNLEIDFSCCNFGFNNKGKLVLFDF